MKARIIAKTTSIIVLAILLTTGYSTIYASTNIASQEIVDDTNFDFLKSSREPIYFINILEDFCDQELIIPEMFYEEIIEPTEEVVVQTEPSTPVFQELSVRLYDEADYDLDVGTTQELTTPTNGDSFIRGNPVTIDGILWDGLFGWEGETVFLYYNVTRSQFEGNKVFYQGNPQYEVNSTTTSSTPGFEGTFQFIFTTSEFTASPFSKVGDITLLTWFDGSISYPARVEGSPGDVNVTFYGEMKIDVPSYSVTNPSTSYSFTTQILFDNDTVVNTVGTTYDLDLTWDTVSFNRNLSPTFGGTNQHTYADTAPGPAEEQVTYEATYDMLQLSIPYFVINGSDPDILIETTLYETFDKSTSESLVVDAYYVTGGGLTKGPIEIELDTDFTVYANLSSSAGLVTGYDVSIIFNYNGGSPENTTIIATNATGEIQTKHYFDNSSYPDITSGFTISFEFYHLDFGTSRFLNDSLDSTMTVDIGSIDITILDTENYYTTGMQIDYDVEVRDVHGTLAPQSRYQLNFPGIGVSQLVTPDGTDSLSSTVPTYIVQNMWENIVVTALAEIGAGYRYYVPGSVNANASFDLYFTLALTLYYPNGTVVADGTSSNEWNIDFWNSIVTSGEYFDLYALDQWGRFPVGAPLGITFMGELASGSVTAVSNNVTYDSTELLAVWTGNTAYLGDLVATAGVFTPAPTVTVTLNVFGPDNFDPVISSVVLTPDPDTVIPHSPYYDITVNIVVSDVGSGIQWVIVAYQLTDENNDTVGVPQFVVCTNTTLTDYSGLIDLSTAEAKYHVYYQVQVGDYANQGINSAGGLQTNPAMWYSADPLDTNIAVSVIDYYRVGDYQPPQEDLIPDVTTSVDITDPWANISYFISDGLIDSGMGTVRIYVNRTNMLTDVLEVNVVNGVVMTNVSNEYFYFLTMEYNYNYTWYVIARDAAVPSFNEWQSPTMMAIAEDTLGPSISEIPPIFNGTVANPTTIITFNASVTDAHTNVDTVWLNVTTSLGSDVQQAGVIFEMTQVGTTNVYSVVLDLSTLNFPRAGTYALQYSIFANDTVENVNLVTLSMSVIREASGLGIDNLGAIIGGSVGGLVVVLAGLFLWFNRHTIKTYASKQTFRRRLRDYLREIIEDIKRDGLEGRYKQGLLKTWSVLEGIGREFFELPRYRSQTPTEFARLLAYKGKIERQLMGTLLEYFEKARYGYEEITEKDFNSGVRALLKIVDKIEVGEMKIES